MKKSSDKERQFIYYDSDFTASPDGWLRARLENRLKEGYEIWRDEKEMAWKGVLSAPLAQSPRD
jgi:hypothetical protein